MSSTVSAQIRAYFASLPSASRRRMKEIRGIIKSVAPDAEEAFSYRIPAFRLDGRILVYYAAFTGHCSLFPMGDAIRRAHAASLEGYKTSKGTVQFPLDQALPVSLVKRLVKARITELRARTKKASD